MTGIRNQPIAIPNAEDACSIDIKIPSTLNNEVLIPFGLVETETIEKPKGNIDKTSVIAITPYIFNEPSLSKNKAYRPNFIEKIDNLPKNSACGYIYIFVDGFLWREIACVDNGLFSDVDLMTEHSKDERRHYAKPARKIILPTRTKGLYNGDTLAPVVVEMAFSRVQWSWQYINDLGGMFVTDKRFAQNPLLSKCVDLGRGELLRKARCQKIDFSENNNPSECQFIHAKGCDYRVYLHDMVGIAHRFYVMLDNMVNVLDSYYQINKQKPYYDSALLAYQLYLNEELHKREYDPHKSKYQLKDQSDEAESLRDIAQLLDAKEIEKMLISPDEITVLEQYLDTREALADFLNGLNNKQKLTALCSNNKTHAPTEWHVATRDLSTLAVNTYHTGQAVVYNILNRLVQQMAQLPIFIKALTNGNKKYLLRDRMKKIETKTNQLMLSLSGDDKSWLRMQFCANVSAFGKDMKQAKPELVDPKEEPGIFDPEKLSEAFKNSQEETNYVGDMLKSVKASSALSMGVLAYWKQNLTHAVINGGDLIETSFKVVGPTLKSMGTDVFKDLEFSKFGEVPAGYTVVGGDIVEHTLFNAPRYKRARRALENAVGAIDSGQKIAKRDLRIIEKYAPHGTHTSTSEQRNTVITDRHTGATVGVTTRAGARALIQKGLDVKGFLKSLRTLEMKVLMVPSTAIPQIHAPQFNQENPLRRVAGIRLDKVGQYSKNFHQSVPGAIFLLDSMLTIFTYNEYKKNFEGRGRFYTGAKNVAVMAEWAVSGAQAFEAYVSSRTIISQELAIERVKHYNTRMERFGHSMKITRLTIAGGAAGILGATIVAWDAWQLLQKQDNDAAAAAAASAGFGIALGIGTMVGLSGPIVWALILGSVAFGFLSSMLVNTDTQNWAEFGPFGKDKAKRLTRFSAFNSANAYYNFISAVLMSPSINIKRIGQSNNFIITIYTPLYDELNTDVYINVRTKEQIFKNGHARKAYINVPINYTFLDKKITHKIAEPKEIRNQQGRITQLDYQAFFKMDNVDFIEAKTSLVINNIHYPQNLSGYENINYDTDNACYSEDAPLEEVVNQPDWARDKYSNAFFSRIVDEIQALF